MRAATSLRLLLVPAALLASACDDSSSPLAPEELPVAEAEAPDAERTTGPLEDLAYWADGYLWAATVGGTVTPVSNASFNRSGGAITVTKVAGTTGRYLARFRGSLRTARREEHGARDRHRRQTGRLLLQAGGRLPRARLRRGALLPDGHRGGGERRVLSGRARQA